MSEAKAIDRISQYIDYKGYTNSSFEQLIGVSNGYIGTQLKRNANLGEGILTKVLDYCLDMSPEWLLTGKGLMLKDSIENSSIEIKNLSQSRKTTDSSIDVQEVPLYNALAVAGLKELFDSNTPSEILDTIKIPGLPRCDGAITITGDSMYPLLKSGDMVLYAITDRENIFYGEMYLLGIQLNEWEEFITVKYIHRSQRIDHIVLVSQNRHHDDKEIPISSIRSIALVKASIRINTML